MRQADRGRDGPHPSATTIAGLARDTLAVLQPHTREEEAGLSADNLRAMIDEPGLTELGRELDALRARAQARLAAS